MPILNVEIKARCIFPEKIRALLESRQTRFLGIDHQVDHYFRASNGRLKLREGNIENALIYYQREDQAGPKTSQVELYYPQNGNQLKTILERAIGTKVVVDKKRAIYFIDNVKFHLDQVEGLGSFVEIEAIDEKGTIGLDTLSKQCQYYLNLFEISPEHLLTQSYSDMLLNIHPK